MSDERNVPHIDCPVVISEHPEKVVEHVSRTELEEGVRDVLPPLGRFGHLGDGEGRVDVAEGGGKSGAEDY